jgi:hypothetical protein
MGAVRSESHGTKSQGNRGVSDVEEILWTGGRGPGVAPRLAAAAGLHPEES